MARPMGGYLYFCIMNHAVIQYFDRAAWALQNAGNDKLPLSVKSHLIAAAVHACQSLKESLDQLVEEEGSDTELEEAIKSLPHIEIIQNVRNMDLHGWPLPVCDPKVQMVAMVAKPGKPITLSSSHGVGVTMQMDGLEPKVHRSPNYQKHGTVTIGGATVSYGCVAGKLIVHDFSTGKDYVLLDALRSFLKHCYPLVKDRMPATNAPAEEANESTQSDAKKP